MKVDKIIYDDIVKHLDNAIAMIEGIYRTGKPDIIVKMGGCALAIIMHMKI